MFTSSVTQNKSLTHSLSCSCPLSLLTILLQCVSFACCLFSAVAVCLFCGLSCPGCWPSSRSGHSLKMTTGLLSEVDAARWPNMQGRASLSRAETGAYSVICQMHCCCVRHVVIPTAYCSHGSNRPSQPSQVPASEACHIYMRL